MSVDKNLKLHKAVDIPRKFQKKLILVTVPMKTNLEQEKQGADGGITSPSPAVDCDSNKIKTVKQDVISKKEIKHHLVPVNSFQ